MRRLLMIATGAAMAMTAAPCFAESVSFCSDAKPDAAMQAGNSVLVRDTDAEVAAAPAASTVSRISGIDITAGDEGGTASLRLGGDLKPRISCNAEVQTTRLTSWSVTVAAPLDKSKVDGQTRASLDGFSGTTSLDFNVRRLSVSASSSADLKAIRKYCATFIAEDEVDDKCDQNWILENDPDRLPGYFRLAWGDSPSASVWGATGKVGQADFDYYDPATLAKMSDHRTAWSARAYFAYKPLNADRLYTFQYERQLAWEGQEDKILCPAAGPASSCVKGAPGKPTKVERDILSAELRQRTGMGAFALNLSYDAANEVSAIGLPVYLTSDEKGSLIGGIRFDWRSDTGEAKASIFVGTPLTFALP